MLCIYVFCIVFERDFSRGFSPKFVHGRFFNFLLVVCSYMHKISDFSFKCPSLIEFLLLLLLSMISDINIG